MLKAESIISLGIGVFAAVILAFPSLAALPTDADTLLTELEGAEIPVISEAVGDTKSKFKKKGKDYYEAPKIKIGKVEATLILYKTQGAKKYMFAVAVENLSLNGLGLETGPLDQLKLGKSVVVYLKERLGSRKASKWPGKLGEFLKDLSPPSGGKLKFDQGLNFFARLDKGASGKTADLLKAAGLDMETITVEARRFVAEKKSSNAPKKKNSTLKPARAEAKVMRWGDWKDPFGFKGASLKNMTISLKEDVKKNKTFQAWGDFVLKSKPYFLWGGQSSGKSKNGRAFGLGAKEISMKSVMDFVDTMPAMSSLKFGKAVSDKLPLADIKIKNDDFVAYKADVFPDKDTFIIFYADNGMDVANTGKTGPLFSAGGSATILKWDAASLKMTIDPKNGKYDANASMGTGDLSPLPMGNAGFSISVDKPAKKYDMKFNGDFEILDVTLAAVDFSVSKTKMNLAVDLGCLPPMMMASIDAKYSLTSFPDVSLRESGCAAKVAEAIVDAAKAVGHTLSKAVEHVGNAIADLGRAIKGEKKKITNGEIPLFRTAARHMLLQAMLDDWKDGVDKVNITSIVFSEYKIPFDMGTTLPKVFATKKKIEDDLDDIECQADGRISVLLDAKDGFFGDIEVISDSFDAELDFYKPFKDRISKVKKAKKDLVKKVQLDVCVNG